MYTAASLRGRRRHAPGQHIDAASSPLQTPVVPIVAIQEAPAVGLDEALQIFVALRVVGVVEQPLDLDPVRRDVIIHDVAHTRMKDRLIEFSKASSTVGLAEFSHDREIREGMRAAAGKELLRRRRIVPLQRRLEHRLQAAVLRARQI